MKKCLRCIGIVGGLLGSVAVAAAELEPPLDLTAPQVAEEISNWVLSDHHGSTGFTVSGDASSEHQFGMLKQDEVCTRDEMYLAWSTSSSNVWNLSGQRLALQASFDGTRIELPLEVVAIKPLPAGRKLVELAHAFPNEAILEVIGNAKQATIAMPEGIGARYFDIDQDTFSLAGFNAARADAQAACDYKSLPPAPSWVLENQGGSTAYTIAGAQLADHHFGMLKHSNLCGRDEMYLALSSSRADIWDLSGQRVKVAADFDGTQLELPLEVVAIKPLSDGRKLVELAHGFPSEGTMTLIGNAEQAKISISDEVFANYFDGLEETFSLSGFADARAQAQTACDSRTMQASGTF